MNLFHGRIVALGLFLSLGATTIANAGLDDYVKKPDPSFSWKIEAARSFPNGSATQIALNSQTWRGIVWTHKLQIYEPTEIKYPDAMLLFITGGDNHGDRPLFKDAEGGFALAKACGARVAVLPQVPNQPLLGGKVEDDLIAETFVNYLKDGDETWPLLFPMVKSAVRAMDATQQWARGNSKPVPAKFVVSGASKRGWTTWLTGASDPRAIAIAPMVIPTLNMPAQNKHQVEVWGKFSEQIDDYTRRGLTGGVDTPERLKLAKMVDPYTYLDRLTMPKLQINGTNDPYWTLDSMNLYWNDLKGPKYVVYLPNAGHDLKEHHEWAINGVGALFRHAASGRKLPEFSWTFELLPADAGKPELATIRVHLSKESPIPKSIRMWRANSSDRDFRKSRWEISSKIGTSPQMQSYRHGVDRPETGFGAMFADLTFEGEGLEYHLSSQIFVFDSKPAK